MFLRITAKWVAFILAGAYTLQLLAYHVWSEMAVLWLSLGAGFFFIRLRGVGPELVWWDNLRRTFTEPIHFVQKSSTRRVVGRMSVSRWIPFG